MCAIVGALFAGLRSGADVGEMNLALDEICDLSEERGRDGFGYRYVGRSWSNMPIQGGEGASSIHDAPDDMLPLDISNGVFIANLRAEPTTEYVKDKRPHDQQPYTLGGWSVVHNGTVANDKELRSNVLTTTIDSAAIVEALERLNPTNGSHPSLGELTSTFKKMVKSLKGSYAILAFHKHFPNSVFVACNYRPIWTVRTKVGVFFASSDRYLPFNSNFSPRMVTPYSYGRMDVDPEGRVSQRMFPLPRVMGNKALVVCSGGLDSVVAATFAQKAMSLDVELIHFLYGSRAEAPEVEAVKAVAERLHVPLTLFPLPVYKPGDSPLLDHNSAVAGGEEGAEFAHEWVPARNLLLLSVATAYAEANGFNTIILGNNLEEAGAYPDNEPEFIAKFNAMLPFAVADGYPMTVSMPVGNMMKHEIVALGIEIGAPLDLTWSCYRAGQQHCGRCGPCFMRRKAFEINNTPEVITYAE